MAAAARREQSFARSCFASRRVFATTRRSSAVVVGIVTSVLIFSGLIVCLILDTNAFLTLVTQSIRCVLVSVESVCVFYNATFRTSFSSKIIVRRVTTTTHAHCVYYIQENLCCLGTITHQASSTSATSITILSRGLIMTCVAARERPLRTTPSLPFMLQARSFTVVLSSAPPKA